MLAQTQDHHHYTYYTIETDDGDFEVCVGGRFYNGDLEDWYITNYDERLLTSDQLDRMYEKLCETYMEG